MYTLDRLQPHDIPVVTAIDEALFSRPWKRSMFQQELAHPMASAWVLRRPLADGPYGMVGYACLRKAFDEIEVLRFAIDSNFRGRGLGRWLLQQSLSRTIDKSTRRVTLEVRTSNRDALRLYVQAGFELLAVRPGYYSAPREDAQILVKNLQEDL